MEDKQKIMLNNVETQPKHIYSYNIGNLSVVQYKL